MRRSPFRTTLLLPTVALAFLCGCATLTFTTLRDARFINMDGNVILVDYGKEKRTTQVNGVPFTFEDKVRVTLPDGKRRVLYQTLSASGVRYTSANGDYTFFEKGPYCIILYKGKRIFEGVYCRKE